MKILKEELESDKHEIDSVQFMLFSATIPKWVEKVAAGFMKKDAVIVDMVKNSDSKTPSTVEHLALFFPSRE